MHEWLLHRWVLRASNQRNYEYYHYGNTYFRRRYDLPTVTGAMAAMAGRSHGWWELLMTRIIFQVEIGSNGLERGQLWRFGRVQWRNEVGRCGGR